MNLSMCFTGLILAFILLADPGSSTCGTCDINIVRAGALPDTTLTLGSTWEIIVTERFAKSSDNCFYADDRDIASNRYNAPDLFWKIEGSSVTLQQINDTLYVEALNSGASNIFISTSSKSSIDPNVVNQHLTISVK
ncbi:MAG: hypothetical protein NXI08_08120 [bacterium]|nr:hypothetical protein [bacterium]